MNELINLYQKSSAVLNLVSLAITILTIVSMWMVFAKAGQGGWKILIPIYNAYTKFKIAHAKKRFWVCFLMTVAIPFVTASAVAGIINDIRLVGGFGIGTYNIAGILGGLALALVIFIINITVNFSMAKAFGLPSAFGLGLWLLPVIFYAIIAFNGNIQYVSSAKQPAYLED